MLNFKLSVPALIVAFFSSLSTAAPYKPIYPPSVEPQMTLTSLESNVKWMDGGKSIYKQPSSVNIAVLTRTESQQRFKTDDTNKFVKTKLSVTFSETYDIVNATNNAIVVDERVFDENERYDKILAIKKQLDKEKLGTIPLIILSQDVNSDSCLERTTKVLTFCVGEFYTEEMTPDLHTNFDAFIQPRDNISLMSLLYKIAFMQSAQVKPYAIKAFVEQGGLNDMLPEKVSVNMPRHFNHGLADWFLKQSRNVAYKTPSGPGLLTAFGATTSIKPTLVYAYGASSFPSAFTHNSLWVSKGASLGLVAGNHTLSNLYIVGLMSGYSPWKTNVTVTNSLMMDEVHPQSDIAFDNINFVLDKNMSSENMLLNSSIRSISVQNPAHKTAVSRARRDLITTTFPVEPGEWDSNVMKTPPKVITQDSYTLTQYNESESGDVSVLHIPNGLQLSSAQFNSLAAKYKPETVVFHGRNVFEVLELPYNVEVLGELRLKQNPIYRGTKIKGNLTVRGAFLYESAISVDGAVNNYGVILDNNTRGLMLPSDSDPYGGYFYMSTPRVHGLTFNNQGLVFGISAITTPLTRNEVSATGPHNISGNFGPSFTRSPMFVFYKDITYGYSGFGGSLTSPERWFADQFKLCATCGYSPALINTIHYKYNAQSLYARMNSLSMSPKVSPNDAKPEPKDAADVGQFIISKHPNRIFGKNAEILNACADPAKMLFDTLKEAAPDKTASLKLKIDVESLGKIVTTAGVFIASHYFSEESLGYGDWDKARVCGMAQNEAFGKVMPGFDSLGTYTFMLFNGLQSDILMNKYIMCMTDEAGNLASGITAGLSRCDTFYHQLQETNGAIMDFAKNITPDNTCASYVSGYKLPDGSIDWAKALEKTEETMFKKAAEAITMANGGAVPAKVASCAEELAKRDLATITTN